MRLLCVDGHFQLWQRELLADWPDEGEIYTIRRIRKYDNGREAYLLNEIHNFYKNGTPLDEVAFRRDRFVILEEPGEIQIEQYLLQKETL
jgi:hypothetical protein